MLVCNSKASGLALLLTPSAGAGTGAGVVLADDAAALSGLSLGKVELGEVYAGHRGHPLDVAVGVAVAERGRSALALTRHQHDLFQLGRRGPGPGTTAAA